MTKLSGIPFPPLRASNSNRTSFPFMLPPRSSTTEINCLECRTDTTGFGNLFHNLRRKGTSGTSYLLIEVLFLMQLRFSTTLKLTSSNGEIMRPDASLRSISSSQILTQVVVAILGNFTERFHYEISDPKPVTLNGSEVPTLKRKHSRLSIPNTPQTSRKNNRLKEVQ